MGGVASFFCSARGDPVPSIVWRKNGKKVPGTQSRYTVTQINGLSILRIEPVRAGRDEAPYECVAENGVGDAVSAEAMLTVYEGKILERNEMTGVAIKSNASISSRGQSGGDMRWLIIY